MKKISDAPELNTTPNAQGNEDFRSALIQLLEDPRRRKAFDRGFSQGGGLLDAIKVFQARRKGEQAKPKAPHAKARNRTPKSGQATSGPLPAGHGA